MKKFIFGFIGFILALVLLVAVGFGYIALGLAPVSTASPPLPFEKSITRIALKARVNKEAPKSSPIAASDDVYAAGARIYRNNCAVCHGLPGQELDSDCHGRILKPRTSSKAKA